MKFGVYATGIALILFIVNLILPTFADLNESDKLKIEYTISIRNNQLKTIAEKWIRGENQEANSAFRLLDNHTLNKFKRDGLAVYFAQNNEIVAWSSIPNFTYAMQLKIDSTLKLYKFNDGYYLAAMVKNKDRAAIYTIEIQKKFHINNAFLKDNFNPIFNIPQNVTLGVANKETSNHTYNISFKGKPLFSLTQKTAHLPSSSKEFITYLSLIIFILGTWNIIIAIPFGRKSFAFFSLILAWIGICSFLGMLVSWNSPNLYLFSPELYSSVFAPSLGILFIYILIFCTATSAIYYHYVNYKIENHRLTYVLAVFHSIVIAVLNYIFFVLIVSLVNDSTISFGITRIVELSRYSILLYFIISLVIISIILITNLFFRLFKEISNTYKTLILGIPLGATSIYILSIDLAGGLFVAASAFMIYLFFLQIKWYKRIGIGLFSFIIVAWAIATSVVICHYIASKDTFNKIAFAESLYNENDPILESIIPDLNDKLKKDTTIARLVNNPLKNEAELNTYIRSSYLNGYISKYDLLLTICPEKAQLLLPQEKRSTDCRDYFESLFVQLGSRIPNSNFYFIRNYPGQLTYIGDIKYNAKTKPTSLFVELDVKTINNNPGYPELLIKKSQAKNNDYKLYDYALYIDGKLMAKNGNYPFPSLITPPSLHEKYNTKLANGYSHLYYRLDKQNTLVVSRAKLRIFDVASSFSYIFLLLAFWGIILLKRSHFPLDDSLSYRTFKGKITLSFIFVLTTALALAALGSLIFGIIRFDNSKQKIIQDKMKSAIPAVLSAISSNSQTEIANELIKVSNYLYVDVNLYDKSGNLFATSRPEVFYEGLQGYKMSPEAYKKMVIDYEGFYVDQENIGSMKYTSSYSPLFGNSGELLAYVNLPYFQEYNELRNEIYTIAIATTNIFILLLLPVIFIGIIISNSITRPLALISSKMRLFDLKTNLEPIPYTRNDEIGDLISEFNKMVVQVKQSAEKLANSERESAWREMARQIAHEIKNPLTPMKLSLQYLMMLKNKGDKRWLEQFDRYAVSQIEQIDSLAKIATEFSDFSKINFDHNTPIFDIRDLIVEVIPIFDGIEHLVINTDLSESPCTIHADREHVKRIFVNILKNATQSFDKQPNPEINIRVRRIESSVLLSVEDNGRGIDKDVESNVFVPNFTTKSSGSGLGLAISKNLAEAYHGSIWFTSEVGKGTIFYVEFPFAASNAK